MIFSRDFIARNKTIELNTTESEYRFDIDPLVLDESDIGTYWLVLEVYYT